MSSTRQRIVCTVLTTVALTSSCSSGGTNESRAEDAIDLSGRDIDEMTAKYPTEFGQSRIQTYIEGDGQNRWVRELIIGRATQRCMNAEGFDYPELRWTREEIVEEWTQPVFVGMTVDQATTVGYPPRMDPAAQNADAADVPGATLTGDELERFKNTEADCVGNAIPLGFVDLTSYQANKEVLDIKMQEFRDAFAEEPTVRELIESWRECVSQLGREFASIDDARSQAAISADDEAKSIAIADAQCRADLAFDDTYWQYFASAEAHFMRINEPLVMTVFRDGRAPMQPSN